MKAGALRHRVTILRPVQATSATSGEVTTTWEEVATVFAQVKPRSAYQREQAAQTIGTVTHDVFMRWTADMIAGRRLQFGTRILKPVGPPINVDERNREIRIPVVEVA